MNEQIIKGKWTEFKGEMRKTWGKITGDEYEATKGDIGAISGLVQQRYGLAQEEAKRKVSEMATRYGSKAEGTVEKVKDKVSSAVENAKEKLRN